MGPQREAPSRPCTATVGIESMGAHLLAMQRLQANIDSGSLQIPVPVRQVQLGFDGLQNQNQWAVVPISRPPIEPAAFAPPFALSTLREAHLACPTLKADPKHDRVLPSTQVS